MNRFQGTPRHRFRQSYICSLVGRYNNSVPTRFLAPIDCSKIPAQLWRQFNTSAYRPNNYKDLIQCATGEEGMGLQQRADAGAIHCVFYKIPNLQNCFSTPNKTQEGMGPQTPAAKSLYWSIFKKSRHLGFGVFMDIWSMLLRLKMYSGVLLLSCKTFLKDLLYLVNIQVFYFKRIQFSTTSYWH